MLCDICHKVQATVHLTEIVDDQMAELHLCEDCARQKGTQMEQHFGLADLLGGLADVQKPVEEKPEPNITCATCGLKYSDFRKIGRLGCGDCYVSFEKQLSRLLRRIHGADRHFGKVSRAHEPQKKEKDKLGELKEQLKRAIELEEFEKAAHIRDEIHQLELQSRPAKKTKTRKSKTDE